MMSPIRLLGQENQFKVFALGTTFDVDAYVATSALKIDRVWHRGDLLPNTPVNSQFETSGLEIRLGDGLVVPLTEQEEIALAYLKAHRDELRALSERPGIEATTIAFQYPFDPSGGVFGVCLGPSGSLMWHALDCGFTPLYYVTIPFGYLVPEDTQEPGQR